MSIVEKAMAKLRGAGGTETPTLAPASVASLVSTISPPVVDAKVHSVDTKQKILIDRDSLRKLGYLPDSGSERPIRGLLSGRSSAR